jgi:hypothetical protein
MPNRMIVQDAKDAISMLFIEWLSLEAIRFKPGVMTPSPARFVLSCIEEATPDPVMTSSLNDGKPIKIHPSTGKNDIDTAKDLALDVTHKDTKTLGAPDINMGIIMGSDNSEDCINISRWGVVDKNQITVWHVLIHVVDLHITLNNAGQLLRQPPARP